MDFCLKYLYLCNCILCIHIEFCLKYCVLCSFFWQYVLQYSWENPEFSFWKLSVLRIYKKNFRLSLKNILILKTAVKGLGKAKRHFWGVFKSFKSIISGVTQPLGNFFHVVGSTGMSFCRGSVNCHGSDGQMYHFCESSRSGEIFLDQYRGGGGGLYSPW